MENYLLFYLSILIIAIGLIFLFYRYLSHKREAQKSQITSTKFSFGKNLKSLFSSQMDNVMIEKLHHYLIQTDIGVELTEKITSTLQNNISKSERKEEKIVFKKLKEIICKVIEDEYEKYDNSFLVSPKQRPFVVLFLGVNGTGKTSSLGKLAYFYKNSGKKVFIIAADTFRAGAVDQVKRWAKLTGSQIFSAKEKSDPSSVIYTGLQKSIAEKADVVLIDTSGRMHNKQNLLNELSKMIKTTKKIIPDAPHQKLLVVDATTGQNALSQVETFNSIGKLSSIIIAKMDGTAKGGMALGIKHKFNIPVSIFGTGEKETDLIFFDKDYYIKSLFNEA